MKMLRCLYVQENLISSMSGMEECIDLRNLNMTDNMLETVSGLKTLTRLTNI